MGYVRSRRVAYPFGGGESRAMDLRAVDCEGGKRERKPGEQKKVPSLIDQNHW